MKQNITKEVLEKGNEKATPEFIEECLKDFEEDTISYIEKTFKVELVGERNSFDNARKDWQNITKAQVIWIISYWRKQIYDRYFLKK